MGKTNLMKAANQWARRPLDETYDGLDDLLRSLEEERRCSEEYSFPLKNVHLCADQNEENGEVVLMAKGQNPYHFSNWSFGQVCKLAGMPADKMLQLPPTYIANDINYLLRNGCTEATGDMQIYSRNGSGNKTLRSVTKQLERVYDHDCVRDLMRLQDVGWMVPPARPSYVRDDPRQRVATIDDIVPGQEGFGLSIKVGDLIAPAGVYRSDRDMFVFMVNPSRTIDGGLMRGVFLENSEVGGGSISMTCFMLENVCGNHICWGASGVVRLSKRHRGKEVHMLTDDMMYQLRNYADSSAVADQKMITSARNLVLGKDKEEVVDSLIRASATGVAKNELKKGDFDAAYMTAIRWEHTAKSDPNTLWGIVHAITRNSQQSIYTDKRSELDMGAGKLLALVAPPKKN